jgi:hypothetical protein
MSVQARGNAGVIAEVEPNRGLRSSIVCRGEGYSVCATTGTMAAALAANASVFAMRLDPSAGTRLAFIERIRLQWTTVVAFTTPVTVGRRLELYRGSGAAAAAGTAIAAAAQKSTTDQLSEFNTAQGGDMRISATAALTVTGITYETTPFAVMTLSHLGAAGAYGEVVFEFAATESAPIVLQPGQLLAIRNPAAMDAAGTWQLGVRVDWHEAVAL